MAVLTKKSVRLLPALLLVFVVGATHLTAPARAMGEEELDEARKSDDPAAYRAFASKHPGDEKRGETVFMDSRLACVNCHGKLGDGGDIGPDLAGVGRQHDRDGLITEILEPSNRVVPGYGTVTIRLRQTGKTLSGKFLGDNCEAIKVKNGSDVHSVPKADVDTWSVRSPMPNGLHREMTLQEFADLIAFLEARREE